MIYKKKKYHFSEKNSCRFRKCSYLCNRKSRENGCNREHSSAGLEHLPYKQGVIGSNPIAPTISSKMIIQLF